MKTFIQWLEAIRVDRRAGDPDTNLQQQGQQGQQGQRQGSGIVAGDYSNRGERYRLEQGKMGEKFIIQQLAQYGVLIRPSNARADMIDKIDGYLGKEPVQIKIRKSSRGDRNDIAFEVCRSKSPIEGIPLANLLQDPTQQGRDYKGVKAKHYFVMNQSETEIYHVDARKLKTVVIMALKELAASGMYRGELSHNKRSLGSYESRLGVQLRATMDNARDSFAPYKVMAFIPVDVVKDQSYPIQKVA